MEIHCHGCGGFIGNPAGTVYRQEAAAHAPAAPHSGLCVCRAPTIHGPVPMNGTQGLRGVHRIRSASRN